MSESTCLLFSSWMILLFSDMVIIIEQLSYKHSMSTTLTQPLSDRRLLTVIFRHLFPVYQRWHSPVWLWSGRVGCVCVENAIIPTTETSSLWWQSSEYRVRAATTWMYEPKFRFLAHVRSHHLDLTLASQVPRDFFKHESQAKEWYTFSRWWNMVAKHLNCVRDQDWHSM